MKVEKTNRGRKAHGNKSKRVAFRCPLAILEKIEDIATDNGVSISAVIIALLKEKLK